MNTEKLWLSSWIVLPDSRREIDNPPLDETGYTPHVAVLDMNLGSGYRVRKEIKIRKRVERSEIMMTAHGIYSLWIDGQRVGQYELAPEHTYYPNQLLYQKYDVTEYLEPGDHVIVVLLADGWYMGRIGFSGEDCQYGNELGLLFQMQLQYEDGSEEIIGSDETFLYEQSAYRYADLFVGECFDETLYCPSFYMPGYQSKSLKQAVLSDEGFHNLKEQKNPHIEIIETIPALKIWKEQDALIVDFGTVLAGRVLMTFQGEPGRKIYIQHSEILDAEGNFIQNIQEAYKNQEDVYICAERKKVIFHPQFTYHGFRYVKIIGLEPEELFNISAQVLSSRMKKTGEFSCSDERLNQLQRNIYRSQISNMIAIPTDCPQREKAGWTGDVQVFIKTACFNQDNRSFMERWLADMRAVQLEDGQIPIIVPYLEGYKRMFEGIESSAGWGDAAIVVPWILYQEYGDNSILEENYEMMCKWINYIRCTAESENPEDIGACTKEREEHLKYIWNTGFHFGDWLTPSVSVDLETGTVNMIQSAYATMHIVPTLFYYQSVCLMEKIAAILGKKEEEKCFEDLGNHIKSAFRYEYLDEKRNIKSDLQGILVLALKFGILNEREEENAIKKLIALIDQNEGKMDTGFLSTPYIMDVLWKYGEREMVYKFLLSEECPSWLYEIKKGATAIWESWQAILPNGKSSQLSMNHYASGCIGDWMYRHIAGIQSMEAGYQKIRISPDYCGPFTWAKGEHISVKGKISCSWKKKGNRIEIWLEIPSCSNAYVDIEELNSETIQIKTDQGDNVDMQWENGHLLLTEGIYNLSGEVKSSNSI